MDVFKFFDTKKADNSFWKNRDFICEIFTIQNNKEVKDELLKSALCYFEQENPNDEFSYKFIAQSQILKSKIFGFPIMENCKANYEFTENEMVKFFIELDKNLTLVIKFEGVHQLESAGNFRHIFCKILYQKNNKKCSSLIPKKSENKQLFSLLPEKKKKNFSEEIKKILLALKKNKEILFSEIGTFANAELNNFSNAKLILKESIFTLTKNSQYSHSINIYSEDFKNYHSIKIDQNLQYHTDMARKCIIWADQSDSKKVIAYNFCFEEDIINVLAVLIGSLIMENTHRESMQNLVNNKKNNWSEFYIGEEEQDFNDGQDMKVYKENGYGINFEEDFKSEGVFNKEKSKIKGFVEMKSKNMALLNRGEEINVLKFDNLKNSFSYVDNLSFKGNKGGLLNPKKIQMLDLDRKMVLQDAENDSRAYYCDLEKGKVIRDYNSNVEKIKDISVTDGKKATFGNSNTFLTVGNNDINRFDIRQENSVQNRYYKTPYQFNKVQSVNPNAYFIGSKTGELRLYNNLNKKTSAKNLIPSLYGDEIIDMDSTLDGKLILLTFKKYILIIKTFQKGKSSYNFKFLKIHKPKPILLKIHPNVLSQNNVNELNFNSAKFNEKKNEKESLIVATTDDLLVIWKLRNVLNGNYVSKDGYKLDSKIVNGEFLYDSNNLITTFENDFSIKKVNRYLLK